MKTSLFLLLLLLNDAVLSQVVLPLVRENRFDATGHDEKKHCLYENRLYSEGAILPVGSLLMICKDVDKREKITRLGWEVFNVEKS